MTKRPLLSLLLPVKNEAGNIRGVLEAVKPYIDRWTVLDTGSTDGTQDIVREVLGDLPGRLVEGAFVDYATMRNQLIDLDYGVDYVPPSERKIPELPKGRPAYLTADEIVEISSWRESTAVFTLMLSADEYLVGGAVLREYLERHRESAISCHTVRVVLDDETSEYQPRVLRSGSDWRYEGVVHETAANRATPDAPIDVATGVVIEHRVSDPERRFSTIWETWIPMLRDKLEENPKDERALVHLAGSIEALLPMMGPEERVSYSAEAMALYLRRLALPFATETERNFLRLRYLTVARFTGIYSNEEILARCKELYEADPRRPDTALLYVYAAVPVCPIPVTYELALGAARVASEAKFIVNTSPISLSCEWRAHLVAASAQKQLAKKLREALDKAASEGRQAGNATPELSACLARVEFHVQEGIRAGGLDSVFNPVLEATRETVRGATA